MRWKRRPNAISNSSFSTGLIRSTVYASKVRCSNPDMQSFIGCIEMPLRHGMTIGEIAMMVNAASEPKAKLRVVKMKSWHRDDWFDSTGLTWVDPSPNMRSLNAALLYPGIGMLEGGKGIFGWPRD